MNNQSWEECIATWCTHMRAAEVARSTIEQRTYQIGRTARALGGRPHEVTTEQLEAFMANPAWGPATRRAMRGALRAFYRWLYRGDVMQSPAHALPEVRVPRGRPRPTPEAVYRETMRHDDPLVRLAVMLGGACGLRRAEIAGARREDLEEDLDGWCLRVQGKGGHVRLVPLPALVSREILSRPPGWLFPSPYDGHYTPAALGKRVRRALGEAADELGLTPGRAYTTHTLRHRAGTVTLRRSGNLRVVQEFLGHAKPETTAIYTEVSGAELRAAVEAAF